MKNLFNIQSKGEGYLANVILDDDDSIFFLGDMDIDIDGSPDWRRDPFGQAETTLRLMGKSINGQVFPFIVLPPECVQAVAGTVLGCKAEVKYNKRIYAAVVADIGPHQKLGEGSPALARALGINDDPNKGGVDTQVVLYRYWPGVPAVLNGIQFRLQKYGTIPDESRPRSRR